MLGPEHPDTLTSRSNLATAYGAAGRTEEALRLHEETLAIRERVLGSEHPRTFSSRINLAIAYRTRPAVQPASTGSDLPAGAPTEDEHRAGAEDRSEPLADPGEE